LVEWKTADDNTVNRFEVEVAKGNEAIQQSRFVKIGEVFPSGTPLPEHSYQFTDDENNKSGVQYYRLKIIENNSRIRYSAIRPVFFSNEIQWQINPNPSPGLFNLLFQAMAGETINMKVYDLTGRIVKQQEVVANGFIQNCKISLESNSFARGVYLLHTTNGASRNVFRLVKQ